VYVYFVSDLDPSGLDLQSAWERALLDFGTAAVAERMALTSEQVRDPALDIADVARRGIEVKPSDSRAAAYVAAYGDRCWEADILPAAVIADTLDADIRTWLDAERWQQREHEIDRARALL
jgi:hypothetical protein